MAVNKTPISMLQELMVAKHQPIPEYTFKSIGTELQPKFSCSLQTSLISVEAEARNKKDAKQLAAECALLKLGYKVSTQAVFPTITNIADNIVSPNISSILPKNFIENKNYIGELNEFASKFRCNYPVYETVLFSENGQFKFICKFQGLETIGYAPNKKQAKQIASYEMTLKLKATQSKLSAALPNPEQQSLVQLNEFDKEVRRKLEKLSIVGENVQPSSPHSMGYPEIEKTTFTIDEAKEQLLKCKVNYKVTELQSNPFVIVVNLSDNEMTLLGCGSTRNEALAEAFNKALEILQEGCSLIDL